MRTRAAIHVGHGAPQIVDEIDLPEPGSSQIAVKLFASGILPFAVAPDPRSERADAIDPGP